MDEPESALSPSRQMSLLVDIDNLVKLNSQLIIATHSPILMSYPNSEVIYLTPDRIEKINYKETENYKITNTSTIQHQKVLTKVGTFYFAHTTLKLYKKRKIRSTDILIEMYLG